ncbi:MAG: hypothetical protein JNJ54_28555 [Myxococcaceae bacterium]|nr:hypothetical protein [Myxococcaceae bacterium]
MTGVVLALVLASADGGVDWELVPGERVGPITAATTDADLRRLYGPDSLVLDDDLPGGAILIPHQDPGSALHLTWCDRARKAGVCEVGIRSGRFQWRTAQGLTHGVSVDDVARLHGRPLRIEGGGGVEKPTGALPGLGTTLFLVFKPELRGPTPAPAVLRRSFVGPGWESTDVTMAAYTATLKLRELRVVLKRPAAR